MTRRLAEVAAAGEKLLDAAGRRPVALRGEDRGRAAAPPGLQRRPGIVEGNIDGILARHRGLDRDRCASSDHQAATLVVRKRRRPVRETLAARAPTGQVAEHDRTAGAGRFQPVTGVGHDLRVNAKCACLLISLGPAAHEPGPQPVASLHQFLRVHRHLRPLMRRHRFLRVDLLPGFGVLGLKLQTQTLHLGSLDKDERRNVSRGLGWLDMQTRQLDLSSRRLVAKDSDVGDGD